MDLSFDDLMIAFAGYWVRAWPDAAGLGDIAEKLAHEMITVATDAAANYPPGTVLRPRYDHSAEEWRYHIASGVS
ncbi:hypothetical protein L842_2233 [Mycobacterium intracellulare MIN_052511_1280]|nr:hypothetical protein L842_2233 [Mycobacterium intracellulare MIN_052511_1280]